MKPKKAVILAGGYGTRISEESYDKPKPMVLLDDKPILWHILKYFSYYQINEFIICCGYKSYVIKDFFLNYMYLNSDIKIDIKSNKISIINNKSENWKISFIDTGLDTMTGGRIKKIGKYLNKNENFYMTYGDGLSDINLDELYDFHKLNKTIATVSAYSPPGRWGYLDIDNKKVKKFIEKPKNTNSFINCGFFVLNTKVLNFIDNDFTFFEKEPMEKLAKNNQLSAYKHKGFFAAMDTLKDKKMFQKLINQKKAPWMLWK